MIITLFYILSNLTSAQLIPPEYGAYQGAYGDFGPMGNEVSVDLIKEYESLSQKKMVWAYFANDWLDGNITFPQSNVDECLKANVIPYIRIMPWSQAKAQATGSDPIFSMDNFLSGQHDDKLKAYAQATKAVNSHVIIEFAPEVNGDWFPWNGKWNGGSRTKRYGDPAWPDGPEKFRDVYRNIITLFKNEGVKNVTWIFHVDTAWLPRSSWNQAYYYYPGDDYIDWIGLSVFGAQLPHHQWTLFGPKLESFTEQLNKISTTKPVMITEFGAIENKNSKSYKKNFIQQALQSIEDGQFPRVKAINYWHSSGWLSDGTASFRIDSSPEALEAYRTHMARDFWLTEGVFNP